MLLTAGTIRILGGRVHPSNDEHEMSVEDLPSLENHSGDSPVDIRAHNVPRVGDVKPEPIRREDRE
jgi:hypothetical protein